MIPKIIHYCWFGRKDKPVGIQKYMDSWKKHLSDYTIIEWNESNFDYTSLKYTQEAYLSKKYAFVSDVARLHALYVMGGVYLDTDILVLKSFDQLLNNASFIGYEADMLPGTGVIAAEKGEKWIGEFLKLYDTIPFISYKGRLNLMPNTVRLKESGILRGCKYDNEESVIGNIHIYPYEFLCAKDFLTNKIQTTDKTYCIHDYQSSWMSGNRLTIKSRLSNILNKIRASLIFKNIRLNFYNDS